MSDKQRETTISYLEKARENWLTVRASAERADHMNAQLNNLEAESMATLDRLLEELSTLGGVAIQHTESA